MPTIHFDYLMGSAAIDFSSLLAISIGIVAEMRRNHQPNRRMTNRRSQSPGHQTLTIRDRTSRERSDGDVVNDGVRLRTSGKRWLPTALDYRR